MRRFRDFRPKPIFHRENFPRNFFFLQKICFYNNIARGLSYESLVIGIGRVVSENGPSEVRRISEKFIDSLRKSTKKCPKCLSNYAIKLLQFSRYAPNFRGTVLRDYSTDSYDQGLVGKPLSHIVQKNNFRQHFIFSSWKIIRSKNLL